MMVPLDLRETYGKSEERYSLKTKDHKEAVRRPQIEAVKVSVKFETRRHSLQPKPPAPLLQEPSDAQVKQMGEAYCEADA